MLSAHPELYVVGMIIVWFVIYGFSLYAYEHISKRLDFMPTNTTDDSQPISAADKMVSLVTYLSMIPYVLGGVAAFIGEKYGDKLAHISLSINGMAGMFWLSGFGIVIYCFINNKASRRNCVVALLLYVLPMLGALHILTVPRA